MTPQQFNDLANVFRSKLVRSAIHKWGDIGEDIVQEAFLRAYEGVAEFRQDSSFSTWIMGYAKLIWLETIRKEEDIDRDIDLFDLVSDTDIESDIYCLQLADHINTLPTKQRNAVVDLLEGEGSDKVNLFHARQRIKEILSEDNTDEG